MTELELIVGDEYETRGGDIWYFAGFNTHPKAKRTDGECIWITSGRYLRTETTDRNGRYWPDHSSHANDVIRRVPNKQKLTGWYGVVKWPVSGRVEVIGSYASKDHLITSYEGTSAKIIACFEHTFEFKEGEGL